MCGGASAGHPVDVKVHQDADKSNSEEIEFKEMLLTITEMFETVTQALMRKNDNYMGHFGQLNDIGTTQDATTAP